MDFRSGGLLVFSCLGIVTPAIAQDSLRVVIPVLVYNYAGVPHDTLRAAQRNAGRIFLPTGVQLEWHECRVNPNESQKDPHCSCGLPTDLVLKILPQSQIRAFAVGKDVAGLVPPGEMVTDAYVFYDRLVEIAQRESGDLAALLGLIIAHEFGHLFKGPQGHSDRGVMRGEWTGWALARASLREWAFSSEENGQIRRNALARSQRVDVCEHTQSANAR